MSTWRVSVVAMPQDAGAIAAGFLTEQQADAGEPSGMRPTWIPMMSMGTPWPLSQRLDAATSMLGKDRPLLDNHSGTMIPARASHWARMAAAAAARTTTGHGHGTRGSRGSSASEDSTTNLAEVDVEPDVPMWESCSVRGRRSSGTLPSTGDDSESPHLGARRNARNPAPQGGRVPCEHRIRASLLE